MTSADRLAAFCGLTEFTGLPVSPGCAPRSSGLFVSGDKTFLCRMDAWDPEHDRNHLAIVLEACREKRLLRAVADKLWSYWAANVWGKEWTDSVEAILEYDAWLLIADRAIVCQAVVAALNEIAH